MGERRRRGVRPSGERWTEAIERLFRIQADLGWVPPTALAHVAAELAVTPNAVALRLREAQRRAARHYRAGLPVDVAASVVTCRDFRHAAAVLQRSGVPPSAVESMLWATSDRLLGALKARELARRADSGSATCPLCPPTTTHDAIGGIQHGPR